MNPVQQWNSSDYHLRPERMHAPFATKLSSVKGANPALTYKSIVRILRSAGWSSPVARWAHNPKVVGSNPTPATKESITYRRRFPKQDSIIPQSEMAPPNQSFFIEGLWCLSPLSHVQRFAKHQPYDLAIGFALRVCHRPSVDIHRRLDRGVTHQLLLHLHRSASLIEP